MHGKHAWKITKHICLPEGTFEVKKEFIWLNPYIKINKVTIFLYMLYSCSIRFRFDILNSHTREFISHSSPNEKYQVNATF